MTTTTRWFCLLLALASCDKNDESGTDAYMDDDVPAGNCMTGTGCATDEGDDGSTASEATCESTLQCDVGQTCVATFDGDIGEFECRTECIEDMDEARWCIDDDACCTAGSICSPRGYCMPPEDATTDTGDASSSTGG